MLDEVSKKFTLSFQTVGSDTAHVTMADDTHEISIHVWLVTDAFGELIRCTIQLLEGYDKVWCIWEEDTGEYKVTLQQDEADPKNIQITIAQFQTSFNPYGMPDEKGNTIFQSICSLKKFAQKVRNEAKHLLESNDSDNDRNAFQMMAPSSSELQLRHRELQSSYKKLRQALS